LTVRLLAFVGASAGPTLMAGIDTSATPFLQRLFDRVLALVYCSALGGCDVAAPGQYAAERRTPFCRAFLGLGASTAVPRTAAFTHRFANLVGLQNATWASSARWLQPRGASGPDWLGCDPSMLVGIDLNDNWPRLPGLLVLASAMAWSDRAPAWRWTSRLVSRQRLPSVASSSRAPVHDAVAGKLKLTLQDQGELVLKNIERPVQAFRVELAS